MIEIQTNVKQGGVVGGWICFAVGMFFMYVSLWTFILYVPLFGAAFVLSIVAMAQRRVAGGIVLLLCSIIVPGVLFLSLAATRTRDFAQKQSGAEQSASQNQASPTASQ
jgi:hypothetical protein